MSRRTHEQRRHTIAHEDSEVYSVTGWGAMLSQGKYLIVGRQTAVAGW